MPLAYLSNHLLSPGTTPGFLLRLVLNSHEPMGFYNHAVKTSIKHCTVTETTSQDGCNHTSVPVVLVVDLHTSKPGNGILKEEGDTDRRWDECCIFYHQAFTLYVETLPTLSHTVFKNRGVHVCRSNLVEVYCVRILNI